MVTRHTTMHDDLLFDKPQVISIVKTALRRLRSKKIQVDDVIDQIIQYGVQMTRSRFEDLFTSRPNRINGAPPNTIIALIHALFALNEGILTAKEVLTLANAARLPIHMCEQLSIHFSHEEWRNAWFDYLPSTQVTFHRNYLIGRNREFSILLQLLLHTQEHLVMSGPAGIGKTVLAQTLIQEIEVITGQNVTFLYHADAIKSYAQFVAQLANALQIKPLHNEPIELRMASVLSMHKTRYVFIDDMQLDGQLSHVSILSTFSQQFPKVRFIMTTRQEGQFAQLRNIHEHRLMPLDDSQLSSAAMQLFLHMLTVNGIDTNHMDKATLLTICQRANGNPHQIQLLANMRMIEDMSAKSPTYTQLLDTLSVREFALIRLLGEIRGPVSTTFLHFYVHTTDGAHHTQEVIDRLISRGLITTIMIYNQKNVMLTHQLLEEGAQTHTFDTTVILRKLAQMVRHIHVRDYHHITTHDIELVTKLLERLHGSSEYLEDVSAIIVAWQDLWMHANMSASIISLIERCSVQFTNPKRILVDLYLVNSRLHDYRGNTQSALICLQQARDTLDQPQSVKWAEIMLEYVTIQSRQSIFPYDQAHSILDEICTVLLAEQQSYLLGVAHNMRAKTFAAQNNLERAFTSSYSALQYFRDHELSLGHIDALLQRSLIYMYAGDYDIANGILQGLMHQIRPYNLSYLMATAELRLAGVNALIRNTDMALHHLKNAFSALHRIGSAHEILMVADIYSLICYRQTRYETAYIINKESSYLREKLDLPRITYVERLVEDKRAKILSTIALDLQTASVSLTLYDLIEKLWGHLAEPSPQ